MRHDLRGALLVIGLLLCLLGTAMLAPMIADLVSGSADWRAFAQGSAITVFAGGALALGNRGTVTELSLRGAFLLTAGAWFTLSAFGAIPIYLANIGATAAGAFFEASSGLTTTGSTVLTGLDTMARGVLLWRGLLNGIGGAGIIVMALAVLPVLRVGGMQLFQLESSDTSEKMLPRATEIARAIAIIYVLLVAACAIAYMVTGMNTFDAAVHAMTTVSTGGFSTSDRSMGAFTEYGADIVCIVFMILGALPFGLYVLALRGNPRRLFRDAQVRLFLGLIVGITAALTIYLWIVDIHHPATGLRLAVFNVVSIITTTGFATADYTLWGGPAVCAFFAITFLGGCAGSTTGAIKTFRIHIAALSLRAYVLSLVRPHVTHRPYYNGRPVADEEIFSVLSFLFMYFACFTALAVYLSFLGLDFETAVSGAATAISNVGPGLGATIGPAGTFQPLPDAALWALSFGMILGRLELVTVLVLLSPRFWRG
jgi:trk system potassium uptake protein TrkH